MSKRRDIGGLRLGPGIGKHNFRVRQRLVRDHYAPLISTKSVGAVKLDLLLRCIAFSPEHLGARDTPGIVHHTFSYESLHDLVKDQPDTRTDGERNEVRERKLKRKWVADQLGKLENRRLVDITYRAGKRPRLVVLRDDGSEEPYDDPGTAWNEQDDPDLRDRYFTLTGGLFSSGELRSWGAPAIAMYFAALLAEQHHPRSGGRRPITDGTGTWYRPLRWFKDGELSPTKRTLLPFSVTTLETGLAELRRRKLITSFGPTLIDPRDMWKHFDQPRNIYTNHFNLMEQDFTPYGPSPTRAGARDPPVISPETPPRVADQVLAGIEQAANTPANPTSS